MSLPTLTATGNLTAEPELRFTPSGKSVTTFTIACNDRRKDQTTGQWIDGDTTFLTQRRYYLDSTSCSCI